MHLVVGLGSFDAAEMQQMLGNEFRFVSLSDSVSLADADAAIVRADFSLDRNVLGRMPKLQIAARTGVGTELVDLVAATDAGVAVSITPGANTNAVAEGTLAQLLALVKRLSPLTDLVREGRWTERDSQIGGDLEGATLGVVGWGRIGRRVAELGSAFGMKVLGYDPHIEVPNENAVESFDELLKSSDAITLHVPLSDSTRNLIDDSALKKMRAGSVLVNCSRGGLVDLDAALDALRSGRLGGLGLDSFEPEPPAHHPVFDQPNVILSPHVMGLSPRAKRATFLAAAESIKLHFQGDRNYPIANPKVRERS